MNMAAKIPGNVRIGVFDPVRHANILTAIVDIHFCDNRPKAVVSVVIAFDENILAVQPLFKLPVFINTAFLAAFKDEITKEEDRIVRLNPLVMPFDDSFVHFLGCFKRPLAIANDIEMREVII
jgi:hypothetical protein